MDSVIHERLLGVEDDFIKSSVEDVLGFETRFRNLHQVISMAMADNELSPDTLILAHTVSASVGTLAQSFLSLHLDEQRLTTSLHEEFARVLDRDSIAHGQPAVARSPHSPIDSEAAEERSSYPPHIFSAYKWLLKNIHNPYPTEATKEAISTQTGSSREIVDDWFIRARRTMGWTALCKKHHAKSRKETLDAAYRFFVAPDPKRPLDSDLEYDFAMVLNTAKSMYSEKLLKSALAVKLDVVVKDMTPLDRAKRKEDKQLEKQMKKLQAKNNVRAISSYPSPDRSPSRSPDLSLPSVIVDESDCDTSPPEPVAGRKRQSSSSNSSHWTYEVQAGRPNKRPRSDFTSSDCDDSITGLPTPPSSSDEFLNISIQSPSAPSKSPSSPSAATMPTPSSTSRKRRLSDAEAQGAPKRPRNLPIGPRLHAVSDPLPMSSALVEASAFDDWFKVNNFDLPCPATAEKQLEVELFDCSTLYPGAAVESVAQNVVEKPMALVPEHVVLSEAVDLSLPAVETNQLDVGQVTFAPVGELDISCPGDFDFFKWPLLVDGKEAEPSVGNVTDLVNEPFNFCSISSAFDMPSSDMQERLITSFSEFRQTSDSVATPVSSSDLTSLDWLEPYFPLPSTEPQFYQPNDSQPGYSFDLTLFPFCGDATMLSGHEESQLQAEKAEKQRKLRELQEAARKLEEELSVA